MKYEETTINISMSDAHMIACEDLLGEYGGPRRTALDLGAHVGTRSLWLATDGGFDRVWAVECATANFKLLRENIAKNGFKDRIHPILAAVDSTQRLCTMRQAGINHGQCSIAFKAGRGKAYYYMMTTPIDRLMAAIGEVDFVKCDVEGTEYALFNETSWLVGVNCLFVETHAPNEDFFEPAQLKKLGYDPKDPNKRLYFKIREAGFNLKLTSIGQIMAWR